MKPKTLYMLRKNGHQWLVKGNGDMLASNKNGGYDTMQGMFTVEEIKRGMVEQFARKACYDCERLK